MGRDFWQVMGFLGLGAALWVGGYVIQRSGGHRSVIVCPPRWVAWLCGNPRGHGRIDLGDGGMQLLGLIWLLGGPVLVLLGVEFHLRVAIVFLVFSIATLSWFALIEWVNWRQRRAKKDD